jgi:hypothetical protein
MELNHLKNLFDETTDNYLALSALVDGSWHNVVDLMRLKDNPHTGFVCRNWAVRSRISDINKRIRPLGFIIESEIDLNGCAKYRIINKQMALAI